MIEPSLGCRERMRCHAPASKCECSKLRDEERAAAPDEDHLARDTISDLLRLCRTRKPLPDVRLLADLALEVTPEDRGTHNVTSRLRV